MRLPPLATALVPALALLTAPALLDAQAPTPALSRADSLLLYEILSAEDRRDSTAIALSRGEAHPDARIAHIARRARARLRDSTFAARSTLGQPDAARPFPTWAEPEWAGRYRALGGRDGACDPLLAALADSAAQVRQRAIVLGGMRASCVGHDALRTRLVAIAREGSTNVANRRPPAPSWQLAADAVVTLSRVAPEEARPIAERFSRHAQPGLRRAAARAATVLRDSSLLTSLAGDRDGNVREAAIRGLSSVVGHAADQRYLRFLGFSTPQVALAAAEALKGTTDTAATHAASVELARRVERNWASERDIRNALRAVLGQPPREAWQPGRPDSLPWDVVALALGDRRLVEVTMSRLHGGNGFTVELRGDLAPIQAARVLAHVRAGRYNGTAWHRVEPNFVIQGGSPHDNEYSGSGRFIVDELGTVAHPRGTVGMSTRGHSTGDLQWFVNLRDNARLVGAYTVFGVVVEGMDAVDAVMEGDEIYVMREVSASRPARP
ncbi:peptidylprolyl isomerase [Pseudogemmatithrix spongiicola]|uniref:peptidylprolyl isomerase n=1 Tax=Pseudogemmatithrix spongiicola TaxID=3062599 RepID=A0AA49JZJ4_9BACT|nr:peptidylprolyl isomerase [Gemmatimonadaceae bacterium 'strain 138']WKW14750.1 peptidylprolyl isomerase [Gemmatimonadaceae bacterium 'strain 318']